MASLPRHALLAASVARRACCRPALPFTSLLPTRTYFTGTLRVRPPSNAALVRGGDPEPVYLTDDTGRTISPWHDVPLRRAGARGVYNFVCEIPRGTTSKMEISTRAPHNAIAQDKTRDGSPRFYALKSIVNYGALPRTYEDPAHRDALMGLPGDGDPLDVCEIGSRVGTTGAVYGVKVLGALGLVDGGEADWKLLAVRTDDPMAEGLDGEEC